MANAVIVSEAVRLLMSDPVLPNPLSVLEAGCGSTSDVEFLCDKRIVGIDIDGEQLAHNDVLDVKIQGDLQTHALPRNEFDVVVCVDVLEHMPYPEKAIANMIGSLKVGGYLLIAGPEPFSYKGFVAKYTPHSMRFLIFRLLTGRRPEELRRIHGNGQIFIPTYLKPVCSRRNLVSACERQGLRLIFQKGADGYSATGVLRPGLRPFIRAANTMTRCVEKLTNGRLELLLADFVVLLRKVGTIGAADDLSNRPVRSVSSGASLA